MGFEWNIKLDSLMKLQHRFFLVHALGSKGYHLMSPIGESTVLLALGLQRDRREWPEDVALDFNEPSKIGIVFHCSAPMTGEVPTLADQICQLLKWLGFSAQAQEL